MPTGLTASAGEFRSQARNKANALLRLRHRMAIELREPVHPDHALAEWLKPFFQKSRLQCSLADDAYPAVLGRVLDILQMHGGAVSHAARAIGINTSNLVSFLQQDAQAVNAVNQWRKAAKLVPLGGKR